MTELSGQFKPASLPSATSITRWSFGSYVGRAFILQRLPAHNVRGKELDDVVGGQGYGASIDARQARVTLPCNCTWDLDGTRMFADWVHTWSRLDVSPTSLRRPHASRRLRGVRTLGNARNINISS